MKRFFTVLAIVAVTVFFAIPHSQAAAAELKRTIVMLSADDGYVSVYKVVYPMVVKKYGLLFTAYIPGGYIDSDSQHVNHMQVLEMSWNGVEIGNHGYAHIDFTGMPYVQISNDINNAQAKLKSYGLVVTSFAYIKGIKDDDIIRAIMNAGLICARGAWDEKDDQNYTEDFDRWWIESLSFRAFTKTSNFVQMKQYIDAAVLNKSALSIILHDVVPGTPKDYQLNSAELEKTIAYLCSLKVAGKIDVETVSMGFRQLQYYKNLP